MRRLLSILFLCCLFVPGVHAADTAQLRRLPIQWVAVQMTKDGPVVVRSCAASTPSISLNVRTPGKEMLHVNMGQQDESYRIIEIKAAARPGAWAFTLENEGDMKVQATFAPYDSGRGYAEWTFTDFLQSLTGHYVPEEDVRKLREVWAPRCYAEVEGAEKRMVIAEPDGKSAGCNLTDAGFSSKQQFHTFFDHLQDATKADDRVRLSNLVVYPLTVKGKRPFTITTPEQFKRAYPAIFTGKVKTAIVNQQFGELYCNQAGVMFGGGEAWAVDQRMDNLGDTAGLSSITPD